MMERIREKIILYIKNELPPEERESLEKLITENPRYREIYEKELKLERLLFELVDDIKVPEFEVKPARNWWRFVPVLAILAFVFATIFKLSLPHEARSSQFSIITPSNEVVLSFDNPEIVVSVPEKAKKVFFLIDGEVFSGEIKKYDGVYIVKPVFIEDGYHEFKAVLKEGNRIKTLTKTFYVVSER